MAKDKKPVKNQPTPEPISEEAKKISSPAFALQLLNKEKEKKDAAEEAGKSRCKTCFKEIAPTRRCFGHGGGGGGGGGSSTSEEKRSAGVASSLLREIKFSEMKEAMAGFGSMGGDAKLESPLDEAFDPAVIAELIAQGLLLVENNRESRTLTIELLCDPNSLTQKQRDELEKYMETILKEFEKFTETKEFKKTNSLPDDCIKILKDEKGAIVSLRISMPTLALHDAFVQRLANNLVPTPALKEQEEVKRDAYSSPTPLSTKPKPSAKNKDLDQIKASPNEDKLDKDNKSREEKAVVFNPTPFNTKP